MEDKKIIALILRLKLKGMNNDARMVQEMYDALIKTKEEKEELSIDIINLEIANKALVSRNKALSNTVKGAVFAI